ncbi:hypothetical protein [Inquilinus limosus]|uniref:hypothetical protein n=1 Tax=Inquilinus limosus TaxID=171674 RepID=UPI003F15C372
MDSWVPVTVDLAAGCGTGSMAEGDTYSGVEHVEGSDYGDALLGDGAANRLVGGEGDDRLSGHAGDDVLYGGAGTDQLNGADVLTGGTARGCFDYDALGDSVTGHTAALPTSIKWRGPDRAGDDRRQYQRFGQ